MQVKCEYCGSMIDDKLEKCPNCGAPNGNVKRTADNTPKTIEELKKWYEDRNLPPYETTRFFIGMDIKEPKAFGIYEENGEFIVYKNKDTGERAIRYQGTDEAYAVNELYLKLKSEILNQKSRNLNKKKSKGSKFKNIMIELAIILGGPVFLGICAASRTFRNIIFSALISLAVWLVLKAVLKKILGKTELLTRIESENRTGKLTAWGLYIIVFLIVYSIFAPFNTPAYFMSDSGNIYCEYHNEYYVYDGYDYSYVDDSDVPYGIISDSSAYECDENTISSWDSGFTSFEDSNYYSENISISSDSDSDSDYDWDSGSDWSSDSTDWGSDW